MGNFNRGGQRGGGGFNRGGFGGGSKRFTEMHKAICSECGETCNLPFKPTGDRPVFCSNCFEKQKGGDERPNRFGGDRRERPSFEDRQMHNAVCDKCGQDCQVPFRPMAGKPIFCDGCFDKNGKDKPLSFGSGRNSDGVMDQLTALNTKIDKLIKLLDPKATVEKNVKPEVKKEEKVKEVVKEVAKEKEKKEKTKTKVTEKKVSTKKKK